MIEVLFGDSEAGAMKIAKNYQNPIEAVGFGKKTSKEEFDKIDEGKAIGGNSAEVVCIPFLLDIGDISVPIDSEYRKNLILELYTIHGRDDKSILEDLEEMWKIYLNEIERLKNYAARGESVRLWYSDAPYSLCGFYYVCSLLKEYKCKVYVIKLPQYIQLSDNEIQFHTSWGEIEAEKFYKYLPLEKELSLCEMRSFVIDWVELKAEGSTLRAVINGKLIGVPEEFYDHIIKKEIPDGEFRMARLIGNILGRYPIGIGDWWYAKRIVKMIEQGELVVVRKQKEIYCQVLRKA
jgi:hypothetical protein